MTDEMDLRAIANEFIALSENRRSLPTALEYKIRNQQSEPNS